MTVILPPSPEQVVAFQAWPKIPRLDRGIVVTEKIDGTNAAVHITEDGDVVAQSRKRLIFQNGDAGVDHAEGLDLPYAPDNHGFAHWAATNAAALYDVLGPGLHFGEWWGAGVQRGYGLEKGDKRFSLFNVERWTSDDVSPDAPLPELATVPGLGVVPVIAVDPLRFNRKLIDRALETLRFRGSFASPGFMKPEGIVIYHKHGNLSFKKTLEKDEAPKGIPGA